MRIDQTICNRCRQKLGRQVETFLDRKYHTHPCYVITLMLYKKIRKPAGLDELSIEQVNQYLDLRQEFTLEEWKRYFQDE